MKILHVIGSLSVANGSAKVALDIFSFQRKRGNDVDVAILRHYRSSWEDVVEKQGGHLWTLGDEKSSLFNPRLVFRLGPLMKKYDVVHIHLFPSLYWAVLVKILYRPNCKLVATIHNISDHRQEKKWLRPVERFVYRSYDRLVAISHPVADMLRTYAHAKEEQLVTIENGIDLSRFKEAVSISRSELGISEDGVVLIAQVARFSYEKDQKTLLRALALLPDSYHAVFVGDGTLLEEHRSYAESLHLGDRVHFLGSRHDVPAILKASDIVVMSSNFEGFGLVAVEGMASGKPVVASDVPGLADVVSGAGLLFSPHNEHELAEQLQHLSEDKNFYMEVQDSCQKRAEQYSAERMGSQYEALYKSMLQR